MPALTVELATALTDLGHGSRMLSSAEVDSPLSLVMSQFAAVAEKSSAVIAEQVLMICIAITCSLPAKINFSFHRSRMGLMCNSFGCLRI